MSRRGRGRRHGSKIGKRRVGTGHGRQGCSVSPLSHVAWDVAQQGLERGVVTLGKRTDIVNLGLCLDEALTQIRSDRPPVTTLHAGAASQHEVLNIGRLVIVPQIHRHGMHAGVLTSAQGTAQAVPVGEP